MKNKKKTYNLLIGILVLILAIIVLGIQLSKTVKVDNKDDIVNVVNNTIVEKEEKFEVDHKSYKKTNEDYIGYLRFDSDLISLPIVQGESNDTYLRTNFKTKDYDEVGTPFLDARNTLDDQNLIIYGHYVYPEIDDTGLLAFTPLSKLLEESNYKDNKYATLYLEKEERRYVVVAVYYCPIDEEETTDEGLQYFWTNFDKDYFETYHNNVLENALYKTGQDFSYEDKLLTLQTCVEGHNELREVVILKEITE